MIQRIMKVSMAELEPIRSSRCHAKRRPPVLFITVTLTIATAPPLAMAHDGLFGRPMVVSNAITPGAAPGSLRIEVDPSIDDASLVRSWIQDRNRSEVEKLQPADGHDHWVAVTLGGSTYDYRVSVVAMRDGEPVGAVTNPEVCECNSEKLLELIDERISAAVAVLSTVPLPVAAPEPAEVEPSSEETRSSGSGSTDSLDRPPRLSTMGQVGLGVGALGAVALAAGVPLAWRPDEIHGEPGRVEIRSTHSTGIGLAVGGGVAIAAGVSLVVLDIVRRRQRSRDVAVIPVLGARQMGIAISWRARGRLR